MGDYSSEKIKETKSYGLEKVHEANLKVLDELDRICRKYKIQYMLDAGTLIGAVRHQGIIPWDDDVDVVMTRKNFETFRRVVKRELPDTMEYLGCDEFHGGKGFFDFTPRIIYKKSQMHEDNEEMRFYGGKLNHLWVDIFILDNLPASRMGAAMTRLLHKIVYGFAMGHRYRLDYKKYGLLSKLQVMVLANIGRLIPMKWIFAAQHFLALKDRKSKGHQYYYSNYQPDYLYVTVEKAWMDETVELPFCGRSLMAPKEWDKVLTEVYGDYMTPPPEHQRVPSHSSMEIRIYD
ncbi:MAG: phosphorylcholine transferase LicD [Lachnospiraceae bacterium]